MTRPLAAHRPLARAHRPRGFTIIELLLVVTVVGIMMAIVVPRMRITPATEVQLAGMQLAQDLDLARTRALSTRNMSEVAFALSAGSYSGYLDINGDSTITQTTAERLGLEAFGTRPLPDRIAYGRGSANAIPNEIGSGAITFAANKVDFDTRGLPTPMGTAGTVYLQHASDRTAVVAVAITPSGAVRLWTWKNGVWQ